MLKDTIGKLQSEVKQKTRMKYHNVGKATFSQLKLQQKDHC